MCVVRLRGGAAVVGCGGAVGEPEQRKEQHGNEHTCSIVFGSGGGGRSSDAGDTDEHEHTHSEEDEEEEQEQEDAALVVQSDANDRERLCCD